MTFNRALALALALLMSASSLAAAQVSNVEVRRLPPIPAVDATHELTLHLHTFRGTRWQVAEIMSAYSRAGGLLAQCGIALASSDLRVLEAPKRFHYYATPVSRELLRTLPVSKPAIFFVEDTRNSPAFDAEAIGRANGFGRPELVNTVWVAHGARDLPYALAHELVHVLSDSGSHTSERGNLMQAETSPQNNRLNATQCALMRSRGESNGLIKRR